MLAPWHQNKGNNNNKIFKMIFFKWCTKILKSTMQKKNLAVGGCVAGWVAG
jgi:hypothetical protein